MIKLEEYNRETKIASFSVSTIAEIAQLPTTIALGTGVAATLCGKVSMGSGAYCFENGKFYKLDALDNLYHIIGVAR